MIASTNHLSSSIVLSSAGDRARIVESLQEVPAADRAAFLLQITPLLQGITDGGHRANIIANLQWVPAAERAAFVQQVAPLLQGITDGAQRAYIIASLQRVPAAGREAPHGPRGFVDRHLKMRKEAVQPIMVGTDYETVPATWESSADIALQLTDLPQVTFAEYQALLSQLNALSAQSKQDLAIIIGSPIDVILENLNAEFFRDLFAWNDSHSSDFLVKAKFFKIFEWIKAQPHTAVGNDPNPIHSSKEITHQMCAFAHLSEIITNCPIGQKRGVERLYSDLPPQYKYNLSKKRNLPEKQQEVASLIAELIRTAASATLHSGPFLKTVLKINGNIPELPHQALYLINAIGPLVGLNNPVTEDPLPGVLTDTLKSYNRQELYNLCLPAVLKQVVTDVVESKKIQEKFTSINELINTQTAEMPTIWHFDAIDEIQPTFHISELGVKRLLCALGYLKPRASAAEPAR